MRSMDWTQAREQLLARKHYKEVAEATGLHFNSIRNYAIGTTLPRVDNAKKIIEFLEGHERRSGHDRRQEV